ncbi:MAG: GNAT family N-acetyltransferase [Acidimicrobiia bacterium]
MTRDHIRLRAVVPSDIPVFFAHEQNEEAQRMAAFTPPDPTDRATFDAHWERILGNDTIMRTIELDGRVVGHVGSWVQEGDREITYWIDHNHWGKGVATAALALFLDEVTERPLYARAARDNMGSIRVLEKNGFEVIDTDRGYANARGEEIDEVVCRLSAP